MTRLVACDIDGTLLDGSTAIAPAVFTQIRRLSRLGVYFCPASGRQYSSLRRLFAPVAGQLSCLCENGAVVFGPGDPGLILSKTEMAREQALALCRDILALPRCEVLISGANTSYLCPKQSDVVSLMRDFVGNNVALLSAPEETPEAIVKVSAAGTARRRWSLCWPQGGGRSSEWPSRGRPGWILPWQTRGRASGSCVPPWTSRSRM